MATDMDFPSAPARGSLPEWLELLYVRTRCSAFGAPGGYYCFWCCSFWTLSDLSFAATTRFGSEEYVVVVVVLDKWI